jgi:hypothetical protein
MDSMTIDDNCLTDNIIMFVDYEMCRNISIYVFIILFNLNFCDIIGNIIKWY